MSNSFEKCRISANNIRRHIIKTAYECGVNAHIGGALSFVEIIATLYTFILNCTDKKLEYDKRDKFILSKGHGVLGLYCTLYEFGIISEDMLRTFQQNGSDLAAHPVMNLELGIESSNGSLGQGLSMGVGLALSAKKKNKPYKTYVLAGNGECNEGAIWEAAMSASQYKLDNLTLLIDNNYLQSDGWSKEIMNINSFARCFDSFGWQTFEIDGHSIPQIYDALTREKLPGKPVCIVANTIKGKGISFMENKNEWHHNRLTKELYEQAMSELEVL